MKKTPPSTHFKFLTQALEEARKYQGWTYPNPPVGAVLVHQGKILSVGAHTKAGEGHAEVEALRAFSTVPQEATLYVTLEPCHHHGKTPPCTELLIKKKVQNLVYGHPDFTPHSQNQGGAYLKSQGVSVESFPLPSIENFYRPYFHFVTHRKPWCVFKIALTQNGGWCSPEGKPLAISDPSLATTTHQGRFHHDGILTTVKTVIGDNPQMNARLEGKVYPKPVMVLDSKLQMPLSSRVWETASQVILITPPLPSQALPKLNALKAQGARHLEVPLRGGKLDLASLLPLLSLECGLTSLWIEAGATLLRAMTQQSLVNELWIYQSSQEAVGSIPHPLPLRDLNLHQARQIVVQNVSKDTFYRVRY